MKPSEEFNVQSPREFLEEQAATIAQGANFLLATHAAVALCMSNYLRDHETLPESWDGIMDDVDTSILIDGKEVSLLEFAYTKAEDMCFRVQNGESLSEPVQLFDENDVANFNPDIFQFYFIPHVIFEVFGLSENGQFSMSDGSSEYIFRENNQGFSLEELRVQTEFGLEYVEMLLQYSNAIATMLKAKLGLEKEAEPSWFLTTLMQAKSEDRDIAAPLTSNSSFTWFDEVWTRIFYERKQAESRLDSSKDLS